MTTPALTNVVELVLPESSKLDLPHLADFNDEGKALKTSTNLWAILNHYGWEGRYNQMTAEPELCVATGGRLGRSDEGQRSILVDACQRSGVPDSVIDEHLSHLCQLQSYHPVREWLVNGLPWDGNPRVSAVLATLNATNPTYAIAVMRPWLVGCIAALYEERWQSKLVPVLVGGQSFRKSAWINRLASVVDGSTLDCSINPDKPDDVRRAVSCWVVELAELESTTRHETGSLKAFLTREIDRFRIPYARNMTAKKRQTAFIATVNGSGFLKDQTGNARFAVIEMGCAADIDQLNELLGWSWNAGRLCQTRPEMLRQFWLEVKAAYDAGESWFLDEDTSRKAAEVNDIHADKGAYYDAICDYHLARPMAGYKWFTAGELCTWHGEKPSICRVMGKALSLLADEGRICVRSSSGRRREYRLPVQCLDSITKDDDRTRGAQLFMATENSK